MSRTQQRWALTTVMIFSVVIAACSPTATPTPTTRPTATTVPPTAAATAESVESGTAESAATVEATKGGVSLDATLAPIVAKSPTPTVASAATEEATEMMAATEESTEMSMSAMTEESTMMASPTEEMTSMMMAPTEEMTMEATEMMSATEEATMMASPTEEMTMMASPTEEMTMEATAEATSTMEATAELGTIIDVAKADGNFTTLLAALDKAKLTETLEGDGPFTVFAPTDDAFKALLESTNMTAAELLSNTDLAKILEYHVVDGKITADDFAEFKSVDNPDLIVVPTLDGDQKLSITVDEDGTITINGTAKVTLKNVQASNGVIHVIDAVLMPSDMATPEATASS